MNYDFDDIKSLTSNKSIKCSLKKLSSGQKINLTKKIKNPLSFKKILYLAIYIQSNQNDSEYTYFNAVSFNGEYCHKIQSKPANTETGIKDTVKTTNSEIPLPSTKADKQPSVDLVTQQKSQCMKTKLMMVVKT